MNTRLILGAFIVIIGISILLDLNLFRFIIPIILIWIGIQIIIGKNSASTEQIQTNAQEDKIKRMLVFSTMNQVINSDNFQGGEIVTVFGSGEVDLTKVKTKEKNIKLELTAIFGAIQLRLPEQWAVRSKGIGILGTFDNNTNGQTKKTLEVDMKGVAVLGEVKITN